jgi:hypothetical protein
MEGPAFGEGKMIIHAAMLIAAGAAGLVLGGTAGAAAGVSVYAVVLIAWCLVSVSAQVLPEPVEPPQFAAYEEIEEDIDSLEELAQERNWDPGKRLEIARMAHEYPIMTIDELERRYEDGAKG